MTAANPEHEAVEPGWTARSAPVARVSRSVLSANARLAIEGGVDRYAASILDADAWGHGVEVVSEVLTAEGLLRDEDRRVGAGATPGSPAIPEPASSLSPEALFGLPGSPAGAIPAMRVSGTVLSVKGLRAGEGVSYGYAFLAPRDTRVALVTGGYAQGIVRSLGGAVSVAIAGHRHPIVGRVAMDVCVVEIGDADVERGQEVIFLGNGVHHEPSLGEWARATGLHPGELITTVGLRAIREVVP